MDEETKLVKQEQSTQSNQPKTSLQTEAQTTNKWNVILWYFFEISYHFYNCIVNVSVGPSLQLLSIYAGYENSTGVQMTTVCNALANTIAMIASPFFGGLSDYYSFRKNAVIICCVIYNLCFLLAGIFYYNFWLLVVLFCIARTCYELVRLFYDCQIPYIMDQKSRTIAQSIGGAISFTGAILAIVLSFCSSFIWGNYSNVNNLIGNEDELSFGSLRYLVLLNFFLGGFIFVPYLFSKEKSSSPSKKKITETIKIIFYDLLDSFKVYFRNKDCIYFFIAWCCTLSSLSVVNGLFVVLLTTMCGMEKIYTDFVMLGLNVVALIFGFPWAFVLNKWGPKRALQLMLIILFLGMIFLMLTGMKVSEDTVLSQLFVLPTVLCIGPALAIVYTASRQFVMELAPIQQLAQFSAVTKIAARAGGMIMPLVFSSIVKNLANGTFKDSEWKYNYSYRIANIPIFVLLIVSFIFMCLVENHHKDYLQGKRAPYKKTDEIELENDEMVENEVSSSKIIEGFEDDKEENIEDESSSTSSSEDEEKKKKNIKKKENDDKEEEEEEEEIESNISEL